MTTSFGHVGIVARDVDRLVRFYVGVLGCRPLGPRRDLAGEALERGMGLDGAHVRGVHLALPGHTEPATGGVPPVLEIFSLASTVDGAPAVNRVGLMHLAFRVDDIATTLDDLVRHGGTAIGEISRVCVEGVGSADFVYARDPEGNVVELQAWVPEPTNSNQTTV